VGGAVQGAGDQVVHDVKQGKASSVDQYANSVVTSAATGAVLGTAFAAAGQVAGKAISAIKPGGGIRPPVDPYDAAGWRQYYEQNPNAGRSVGAAQHRSCARAEVPAVHRRLSRDRRRPRDLAHFRHASADGAGVAVLERAGTAGGAYDDALRSFDTYLAQARKIL